MRCFYYYCGSYLFLFYYIIFFFFQFFFLSLFYFTWFLSPSFFFFLLSCCFPKCILWEHNKRSQLLYGDFSRYSGLLPVPGFFFSPFPPVSVYSECSPSILLLLLMCVFYIFDELVVTSRGTHLLKVVSCSDLLMLWGVWLLVFLFFFLFRSTAATPAPFPRICYRLFGVKRMSN